jgi:hypothetical protein
MKKRKQKFPPGWDEARVRRVLEYYESQTEAEAIAEDEAAFAVSSHTAMKVPVDLVPEVRELIAQRERRRAARRSA